MPDGKEEPRVKMGREPFVLGDKPDVDRFFGESAAHIYSLLNHANRRGEPFDLDDVDDPEPGGYTMEEWVEVPTDDDRIDVHDDWNDEDIE